MKPRLAFFAMLAALLGVTLLAPVTASAQQTPAPGPIDVTGNLVNNKGVDVGDFTGTITDVTFKITREGLLVVSGVIQGEATKANNGTTTTVPATEFRNLRALLNADGACTILDLDIGRITLDLLGLRINLAPIDLLVTGQTGPGQLLGNLLCAVAGLLD